MKKAKTQEATLPKVAWNAVEWRELEKTVGKLQKRIYRAAKSGDVRTYRKLQKTLIKSWAGRMIAVRRVTQDNRGKATAGVDGVKSVPANKRVAIAEELDKLGAKCKPVRRIYIPKKDGSKRPLGIPTMMDRAHQALVKLALEPEWEARFEKNSYGFRPGKSSHDAVEAIFIAINQQDKYVLDADIRKCFDKINHEKLIAKVNTYPKLRRVIKAWLKAGYMEGDKLFPSEEGTPQGGVISPLLANIALHGLEEYIEKCFPWRKEWVKGSHRTTRYGSVILHPSPNVIRYADDFVVLSKDKGVIEQCKTKINKWLEGMGLELHPEKTRICHTKDEVDGEAPGFDFLGFTVRQFETSEHYSGKKGGGHKKLGFKTIIKPSKEAIERHTRKIHETIRSHLAVTQEVLIMNLNRVIRGWCNYYRTVCSSDVFNRLSMVTYKKLYAWARKRHPNKGLQWIVKKYWHRLGGNKWKFMTEGVDNYKLYDHRETEIIRHVKVKGDKSRFDGDWVYWATRMGKSPEAGVTVSKLLKKQKGKCRVCGLYLTSDDVLEIDHIYPKSLGGSDSLANKQIIHGHCHDVKTRMFDKWLCDSQASGLRGAV